MKLIIILINTLLLAGIISLHAQDSTRVEHPQNENISQADTILLDISPTPFIEEASGKIQRRTTSLKNAGSPLTVTNIDGVIYGADNSSYNLKAVSGRSLWVMANHYAVGEIPMDVKNTSSGGLAVTVPIEVLEGITGMQPRLSLDYTSQSGNGIAGYGWNISGTSLISHRNLNYFHDGKAAPATHTIHNLSLDGKRLIYNGSLSDGNNQFRLEGTFGSTSAIGNLNRIEVHYNNGMKGVFQDLGNIGSLQLTRMQDRFGNYMDYSYRISCGIRYLTRISYGGNLSKGTSHFAFVNFSYESRNDQSLLYNNGVEMEVKERLKTIDTGERIYRLNYQNSYFSLLASIDCSSLVDNSEMLKPLTFSYGNGSSSNAMEKSEGTLSGYFPDGDYKELEAMTGRYSLFDRKEGLVTYPKKEIYRWGKMKGDGYETLHSMYSPEDVIFIAPTYEDATSFFGSYRLKAGNGFRGAISLDADDFPQNQEVVLINTTGGYTNYTQTVSFRIFGYAGLASYGVRNTVNFTLPAYHKFNGYTSVSIINFQTGDFLGDGIERVCGIQQDNGKTSKESKVFIFDLKSGDYFSFLTPFKMEENDQMIVLDYDGDGKSDFFHFHDKGFDVYSFEKETYPSNPLAVRLVKKTSATAVTRNSFNQESGERKGNVFSGRWYARRRVLFGDINGDGKVDVLMTAQYGTKKGAQREMNGTTWTQCLSTGNTFKVTSYEMPSHIWLNTQDKERDVFMHDFNGDGFSDVVCIRNGNIQVIQSTGKRIGTIVHNYSLGGLHGDGKIFTIDIKNYNHNRVIGYLYKNKFAKMSIKNNEVTNTFLAKATNSMGRTTNVTYSRLDADNWERCYTSGNDAQFPFQNFDSYFWAVTGMKTSMPEGTTLQHVSLRYENAVVHRQGLGFCGFRQIRSTNMLDGYTSTAVYDPFRWGVQERIDTKKQIAECQYEINLNAYKEPDIKLRQQKITDKQTGYVTVTNNTAFDLYGNLTSSVTTYGSDLKKEIKTMYHNKISHTFNLTGLPFIQEEITHRGGLSHTDFRLIEYNRDYLPETVSESVDYYRIADKIYHYDAFSNMTSETVKPYGDDQHAQTTYYAYSPNGRLQVSTTNALGQKTSYAYNSRGRLVAKTNFKGNTTSYTLDAFANPWETFFPDNTRSATNRNWSSRFGSTFSVEETATGQPATISYYDAAGRTVATGRQHFNGDYVYTMTGYNQKGLPARQSLPFKGTAPSLWNTYAYDYFDRVLSLNYASGKADTYSYKGASVTTCVDGVSKTTTVDASGKVVEVTDPAGTISYSYRPDGQPMAITAPGGITTSFEYDSYARRTAICDPSAGRKTYTYDNAGNIEKETDAEGRVTQYTYDNFSRITRKEVKGYLSTDYTYNSDGQLSGVSSDNGSGRTFAYDNLMRVSRERETALDGKWLQKDYAYAGGNVAATSYSANTGGIATENYLYANGTLSEIMLNGTASIWKLTAENSLGMPSMATSGNNGLLIRSYGYDDYGLPTSRVVNRGNLVLQSFDYNFNPATGNLNWRKDNRRNLKEDFSYDGLNRLTAFGGKSTSYDAKGNIIAMSEVGKFAYTHPDKPYAVTNVTPSGTAIPMRNQTVAYNGMMRPASITENGNTATFDYNAAGDRMKMQLNGGGVSLSKYYLGGQYEYESGSAGTKECLYLGGDAYSAPAVYVKQSGNWNIYYICRDYQGSITHILNADGSAKQELSYDPWGRLRNPDTQTVYPAGGEQALSLGRGYTGHEHLPWFGLINMNARLYDPVLGRFLSPDPYIQTPDFSQNFNRYSYCLNNPLKFVDPNGEIAWFYWAGAALVGGVSNLVSNWKNIDGFWDGLSTFGVGAGAALGVVATGGAGGGAAIAVGAAGGAVIGANNSIVAQTGQNFSGFSEVDWGRVGVSSAVGAVSSAAGAGAGYAASNMKFLVNGMSSPVLRSAIVSPIAAGAGHLAGGTAANLFEGQSIGNAFANSFEGIGASMAVGAAIGVSTTIATSYANGVSPWTGKSKQNYSVYQGLEPETGEPKYIGITKRNPETRFEEHCNSGTERAGLRYKTLESDLAKTQARIMEQNMINKYRMVKNGGQLYNKINSVAPKYWDRYGIKP